MPNMIMNKACLTSGTRRLRLRKLWGKSETYESRDCEALARHAGHDPPDWPDGMQATKFRRDTTAACSYSTGTAGGRRERRQILSQHRSLCAGEPGVPVGWLCRQYPAG